MQDSGYLGRFLGSPLSAEERRMVLDELFVFGRANQRAYLSRMAVLIVVSTVIAACGLMANSAAVVIGAMLIAPLMRPVMAAAAAISLGWPVRLYSSLALVAMLAIAAVLIALAIALVSPDFIRIPDEVISRTEPTFFDLVIALAAGSAGAYTMTRKESSAIPGVAMAVALLPPLAATGILIDFAEFELALRSFVLFGINFIAMILAGALTFLSVGVAPAQRVTRSSTRISYPLLAFVSLSVAVSVPLYYYSEDVWFDAEYQAANSVALQDWLVENQLELDGVEIDELNRVILLKLLGPDPPLTIEGLYEALIVARDRGAGEPQDWSLDVTWTQRVRSSWPPPEHAESASAAEVEPPPKPEELVDWVWSWRGTQYGDEEWIGLEEAGPYEFRLGESGQAQAQVDCNRARGSYELSGFDLRLEIQAVGENMCSEPDRDLAFTTDLNRVINLRLEGAKLVLRLDNGAGMMHFERSPSPHPDALAD